MGHLLAMILTAFDPRVNPAANLLTCHASHACESLVQLFRTADASAATAEDYTKKPKNMHGQHRLEPTYRAFAASGRLVCVRADRYA